MPKSRTRPSKFGCFTCRARRVKCDETKPKCARCQTFGRDCDGYPVNAPADSNVSNNDIQTTKSQYSKVQPSDLRTSISVVPTWTGTELERSRLNRLASNVLAWDPCGICTARDTHLWSHLLPQVGGQNPVVRAAIAAFGAAYEARFLKNGQSAYELAIAAHYQHALAALSRHIETRPEDVLTATLACTLLGALETIRRNQGDALTHAQGAFGVFEARRVRQIDNHTRCNALVAGVDDADLENHDISFYICSSIDLMITSYARGRRPSLDTRIPDTLHASFSNIDHADVVLRMILHSCLTFTSQAARYKYRPRNKFPSDLVVEQGRNLSLLTSWLTNFREGFSGSLNLGQTFAKADLTAGLIREAQCLTEWIRVSVIHSAYETSYDCYNSEFERILCCTEASLIRSQTAFSDMWQRNAGILYFAEKAISLLQNAGIEGPWHGRVEATIAKAIVEIEEQRPYDSAVEPHLWTDPSHVHERNRVCYYSILEEASQESGLIHWMKIEFAQCANMEALTCSEDEGVNSTLWKIRHQELVVP